MPKMSPKEQDAPAPVLEFVLKDAKDQEVYSAKYNLTKSPQGVSGAPGIMSLTIANVYPLQIDQEYRWELTVRCDAKGTEQGQDTFVVGRIKRVPADPILSRRLQWSSPEGRVLLYADKKLWYETVGALVELRRDRPNDSNLAEAWDKLFNAVGLEAISKEPLFESARNNN
jgi:hypothetical protein